MVSYSISLEIQCFNLFLFLSAPEAILEAEGGMLTDILGNHYKYGPNELYPNKLGVIATGKHVSHKEVIQKLPDTIKQALQK